MLIAISAVYKLEIHQMDVKMAFLNRDLEEEIYLEQPEGFIVSGQEQKVCRLIKSLYGLKQAPKQWHAKFDQVMLSNGFKINECDKCVYVKQTQNCFAILCLYVDDMLITGSDAETVKKIKCLLASKFDMKDMGVVDVILGVKIHKTSGGLALSQSHYIETILGKCKNLDIVPVKTLIDVNLHLSKNTGENKAQNEYASILGSLMYVMNCTRLDIACTVSKLSRFTVSPNENHWKAMKRLLGYLRHTQDYALHYIEYPAVLEEYCDAN